MAPLIDWRYTILGAGGAGGYTDYTPQAAPPGGPGPYPVPPGPDPGGGVPGPVPYSPPPGFFEAGATFWQPINSPAPGEDLFYVQDDYPFKVSVLNFFFLLVTAAAAGNRTGAIAVLGSNNQPRMIHFTNVSQAGSIRSYWQFGHNFPQVTGTTHTLSINSVVFGLRQNFIPQVILEPYQTLRTSFNWQASDLNAADQIANGMVLLRREQ